MRVFRPVKLRACAVPPFERSLGAESFSLEITMTAAIIAPSRLRHRARLGVRIGLAALAVSAFGAFGTPAHARGPEGIADVAEKVIDAVVNISTSQTVEAKGGGSNTMPQLPPGSPFEEFFDDFFKNRRGPGGPGGGGKGGDNGPPRRPTRSAPASSSTPRALP